MTVSFDREKVLQFTYLLNLTRGSKPLPYAVGFKKVNNDVLYVTKQYANYLLAFFSIIVYLYKIQDILFS